jgi:uncharacterized protein YfaP (DUF2135 family)
MQQPQNNHDPVAYPTNSMASNHTVSSRLAKSEQKRLAKQTAILIGIAFVVIIAFIFAVIPGLIRLTGNFSDNGLAGVDEDTVPPRPPSISSPVTATHSAKIDVSGFSEADSEVVLLVNGQEIERTKADSSGTFELAVSFQQAENELTFYSIDGAGNESEVSRPYMVTYDAEPPTIELESPQDGQQFELRKNQTITVKGTTEPNSKVYLNGRLIFANSDGSFSTTYQLSEGSNELRIRAIDKAGNEREQVITVTFRL